MKSLQNSPSLKVPGSVFLENSLTALISPSHQIKIPFICDIGHVGPCAFTFVTSWLEVKPSEFVIFARLHLPQKGTCAGTEIVQRPLQCIRITVSGNQPMMSEQRQSPAQLQNPAGRSGLWAVGRCVLCDQQGALWDCPVVPVQLSWRNIHS